MKYVMQPSLKLGALALASVFALAACSTSSAPDSLSSDSPRIAHIANVQVSGTQSKADLEAMYGGQVMILDAKAGFAVLGFDDSQSEMTTLTLETNSPLAIDDLVDDTNGAVGGANSSSWAGGTGSWAGGTGSWAGGTGSWAGGITLPSASLTTLDMVGISDAHAASANFGDGIIVAVVDTGLDLDHPAFEDRLVPTSQWYDLLDWDGIPEDEITTGTTGAKHGHGTAVAGIVAQVAPKAKIMPIRVLNSDGTGQLMDVIYGIYYAMIYGADVINVSVGSDVSSSTLNMITSWAAQYYEVHIVASAGNEGNNGSLLYPAQLANDSTAEGYIMSVGSVDADGNVSSFSNSGVNLEFLAPGENVFSAYPGDQVGYCTGTSFAAPIVSGMVALGLGESSAQAFETPLADAANPVSGTNTGHGIPQADTLLEQLP